MAKKTKKKSGGGGGGGSKSGSKPKYKWRTKTVTKWRTRNPKKGKKGAAKARAKKGLSALDIGSALRGSLWMMGGMIVAKVMVNKVTSGGSETELWTWPNIATAALSGFLAAFIVGAVFNLPRSATSAIFMGGLALSMYKIFTTKFAPQWEWSKSWFGQDEDINPALLGQANIDIYEPVQGYGVNDGYDTNAMLKQMGFAGSLVPYNPAMGGELVPYNPAMGQISPYAPSVDASAKMLAAKSQKYPGSYAGVGYGYAH